MVGHFVMIMLIQYGIEQILMQRTWHVVAFVNDFLVGCFGFNGPLRQYFSLYRAVSQREGEIEEKE